jgi:hypothetical protein
MLTIEIEKTEQEHIVLFSSNIDILSLAPMRKTLRW